MCDNGSLRLADVGTIAHNPLAYLRQMIEVGRHHVGESQEEHLVLVFALAQSASQFDDKALAIPRRRKDGKKSIELS